MTNDDPIQDIRCAVSATLKRLNVAGDHKAITDGVVDRLPDFFRNSLQVEPERSLEPEHLRELVKPLFLLLHEVRYRQIVITRGYLGQCNVGIFENVNFDAHAEESLP